LYIYDCLTAKIRTLFVLREQIVISISGSAGIPRVEVGDDDLLLLNHGLNGAIGLLAIGVAQLPAEGRGDNLPGQTESVLEPSAFRFLAAGPRSVCSRSNPPLPGRRAVEPSRGRRLPVL